MSEAVEHQVGLTRRECFNWRFGIMGNSAFSQSRTEYSNGRRTGRKLR